MMTGMFKLCPLHYIFVAKWAKIYELEIYKWPLGGHHIYYKLHLKMLGLYLYTLLIGHKSCNAWSLLKKLKLLKELQTFVTNNVFFDK